MELTSEQFRKFRPYAKRRAYDYEVRENLGTELYYGINVKNITDDDEKSLSKWIDRNCQ